MRVCFISPTHWSFKAGGAEYQIKLLIDHLYNLNYHIFYLCEKADFEGNYKETLVKINGKKFSNIIGGLVNYREVFNSLKKINPDLIYIRGRKSYLYVAASYRRKVSSSKLIFHIATSSDVEKITLQKALTNFKFYFLEKILLNLSIRKADLIIGQAKYQNDLLDKNYKLICNYIIPNSSPLPQTQVKRNNDFIRVIWVANLKEKKRPELFFELIKRVNRKYDHVKYIMIGACQDKKYANIVESTNKNPLYHNLEYKGYLPIEQVEEEIGKSHIFISTSHEEGFPNTFIQAWLRHVPVISFELDPDNLIKDNKLGFVVNNFKDFEDKLDLLIKDHNLRDEFGMNAFKLAVNKFSLANIERLERIIRFSVKNENIKV